MAACKFNLSIWLICFDARHKQQTLLYADHRAGKPPIQGCGTCDQWKGVCLIPHFTDIRFLA